MSVRATTWVWERCEAGGNDRLVLLALADEAGDDGASCYPGLRRLARRTRLDVSTVRRTIERLEAQGEVLVKRPERQGRGKFNRYCLVLGRDPQDIHRRLDDGWERVADRDPSEARRVAAPPQKSVRRVAPDARKPYNPNDTDPRAAAALGVMERHSNPDCVDCLGTGQLLPEDSDTTVPCHCRSAA